MKFSFYILALFLISCNSYKSDLQLLKSKNLQLQQENIEIKERIAEITYLKEHSQVVLPNTELKEITSLVNNQTYKIKISLPKGYNTESNTYPVLYVTDAETNFGGVSYIVQRLIKDKLIPPMIIVGIAYGTDYKTFYELRSRDLTPIEDKELRMGGAIDPTGGAPLFCDFLSNELFPFIERNYHASKKSRTLYGHSYGGLFGTYVLLNRTDLFTNYLILSPSLWYYDNLMLKQVINLSPKFDSVRFYIASGKLEASIDDLQNELISKLNERNFSNLTFKAEVLENETHRTIFGAGFTNGMRYLFE